MCTSARAPKEVCLIKIKEQNTNFRFFFPPVYLKKTPAFLQPGKERKTGFLEPV
jgi:hypothetical protein